MGRVHPVSSETVLPASARGVEIVGETTCPWVNKAKSLAEQRFGASNVVLISYLKNRAFLDTAIFKNQFVRFSKQVMPLISVIVENKQTQQFDRVFLGLFNDFEAFVNKK